MLRRCKVRAEYQKLSAQHLNLIILITVNVVIQSIRCVFYIWFL